MSYSAGLVYREFVKAILESATFFFLSKSPALSILSVSRR